MKASSLNTEVIKNNQAILIIDKIGVIGESLAQELAKDYVVFFLSNNFSIKFNKQIIHVPFKGKIPKVPSYNYSKIFIIDDGNLVTKESSYSFIKKAKATNSEVYFLGSIRNIDLKYSDGLIKSYDKVKVLIFGDLFDNKFLFDKNSSITRFIVEARKNKKIKVRGNGLALNYPISFEDTIKLILKAIYIKIPQKAILMFSQHPITDISLANTFQKIDPDIDVDFIDTPNNQNLYFPKNKEFALAKYDLLKKLNDIDLKSASDYKVEIKENSENLNYIKPFIFFLIACLFLLLLPLFSTYTYSFLGFTQVNSAKNLAEKGDFEKSLRKIQNAKTFFNLAKQTSGPLIYEAQLLRIENKNDSILKNINSGINLSNASQDLLRGVIFLQKAKTSQDLNNSINYFKNANIILQELKATNQLPKQMSKEFQNIIPVVELISNSSDVASQLLGFDNEKQYLVLFSNNLELRPGGGVVDSVGLLKIKNGKVTYFKINNTKEIDDDLRVFISTPFFLRRFLSLDNYYLKDSLSNNDFIISAIDASNIYKITSGNDVDGVIALNSNFFKKVLSNSEIDFNFNGKKIKNENFSEVLSSISYDSQKNFYEDIISKISSDFKSGNNFPYFTFIENTGAAVLEKDILLAFKDPNIQNIFTVNKLSNTLFDERKQETNSINDFIGISESNLSNLKINNYISRSISRSISLNENNEFFSNIKITFNNVSQSSEYKSYLQIILPSGSKIKDVSVGGRTTNLIPAIIDPNLYEGNNFKAPKGLEVEQKEQGDKTIYGILINVPKDSTRTVLFSYLMPFKFIDSERYAKYSIKVYKQPGIESFPFEQTFKLPNNFKVLPSESISVEIKKDEIYNFMISNDK